MRTRPRLTEWMYKTALVLIMAHGACANTEIGPSAIERTETTRSPAASTTAHEARTSVWDGVYTEEQAERGRQTYRQVCALCHGYELQGNDQGAPALVGQAFTAQWRELPLRDMFLIIRQTMPMNSPGRLIPQAYIDIISYLLKTNGMPAGDAELMPDIEQLKQILFTDKPRKD